MKKNCPGFTLVELLVAMSIMAILSTIALSSFRTSQMRSRDAQRKSDLKQLSNALELYYHDYEYYPESSSGLISACSGSSCDWGSGEMTDSKTVFIKKVPADPGGGNYYYRRPSPNSYQLYAHLENTEDKDIITISITGPNCGEDAPCNYAVTSTNISANE